MTIAWTLSGPTQWPGPSLSTKQTKTDLVTSKELAPVEQEATPNSGEITDATPIDAGFRAKLQAVKVQAASQNLGFTALVVAADANTIQPKQAFLIAKDAASAKTIAAIAGQNGLSAHIREDDPTGNAIFVMDAPAILDQSQKATVAADNSTLFIFGGLTLIAIILLGGKG